MISGFMHSGTLMLGSAITGIFAVINLIFVIFYVIISNIFLKYYSNLFYNICRNALNKKEIEDINNSFRDNNLLKNVDVVSVFLIFIRLI